MLCTFRRVAGTQLTIHTKGRKANWRFSSSIRRAKRRNKKQADCFDRLSNVQYTDTAGKQTNQTVWCTVTALACAIKMYRNFFMQCRVNFLTFVCSASLQIQVLVVSIHQDGAKVQQDFLFSSLDNILSFMFGLSIDFHANAQQTRRHHSWPLRA